MRALDTGPCSVALVALATLAGGCGLGRDERPAGDGPAPRLATAAEPREAADPWRRSEGRYAIAHVRRGRLVALRSGPGEAVVERVGSRTEFGSRRFLAVAERRGRWLGLVSADRPNGRLGWIDADNRALTPYATDVSLHADLSDREVELREGGRLVTRLRVGIGRRGYGTPTGRFAVTDKLSGRAYGGTYGCCIIALSGHQTRLPPGWPGGDRLALHGTRDQRSIGNRASTGCLRARDGDLRRLLRMVPLGAPFFIRR